MFAPVKVMFTHVWGICGFVSPLHKMVKLSEKLSESGILVLQVLLIQMMYCLCILEMTGLMRMHSEYVSSPLWPSVVCCLKEEASRLGTWYMRLPFHVPMFNKRCMSLEKLKSLTSECCGLIVGNHFVVVMAGFERHEACLQHSGHFCS